jgi:hypothetical protein
VNDGTTFLSWGTAYWIAVGACGALIATALAKFANSFSARPNVFWCSESQAVLLPETNGKKSQYIYRNVLLVDNLGRAKADKIEIFMASKPELIEIQRTDLGKVYLSLGSNDTSWTTENTESGTKIMIPAVIARSRLHIQLTSNNKAPEINSVHCDNSLAERIYTTFVLIKPSEAVRFVVSRYSMQLVLWFLLIMTMLNLPFEIIKAVRK